MQPRLLDVVDYQGTAYAVAGLLDYQFPDRVLRLARLVGGGQVRYLENKDSELSERMLMLSEIRLLDITTPPPATIYHGGESFLLRLSGVAQVAITGEVPERRSGPCTLWRYRAAGDRCLQIEDWPEGMRMLEGAAVHRSMIEVRPGPSS